MRLLALLFLVVLARDLAALEGPLARPDGSSRVDAALTLMQRHQRVDGSWNGPGQCQDRDCPLTGLGADPVLQTTLCLLCYLGAGYDHRVPSRYKNSCLAAVTWLKALQATDGSWSAHPRVQAVTLMALAEAYAMSNDPSLKDPGQRGLEALLASRITTGALAGAWSDPDQPGRGDTITTLLAAMALKSCLAGGLGDPATLAVTGAWARNAWTSAGSTHFPYDQEAGPDGSVQAAAGDADAAGLALLAFTGANISTDEFRPLIDAVLCAAATDHSITRTDPMVLWWSTLGLFLSGTDAYQTWTDRWLPADVAVLQVDLRASCWDGGWPGRPDVLAAQPNPLTTTALETLAMEVLYRWMPVQKADP